MSNLESESFRQPEGQTSILTPEERSAVWCAITSLSVYADRRNQNQVGQPLSDFHKDMLSDRCGEVDFGKWVAEDEANKDANHRALEVLKNKQIKSSGSN